MRPLSCYARYKTNDNGPWYPNGTICKSARECSSRENVPAGLDFVYSALCNKGCSCGASSVERNTERTRRDHKLVTGYMKLFACIVFVTHKGFCISKYSKMDRKGDEKANK